MKEKYLLHASGEKDAFLNLYKKANRLLGEHYEDCAPPADEIERFELIDSDYLRQCRRTNATILIRTITEIKRLWKMMRNLCMKHLEKRIALFLFHYWLMQI